ncbi:uncharacterized protein LOC115210466 [Argonauta hians]
MFALTRSKSMSSKKTSKTSPSSSPLSSAGVVKKEATDGWKSRSNRNNNNRHHQLQYSASHLGCSTSISSGASGPKVTKKSTHSTVGSNPTSMTTSKTMIDGNGVTVNEANLGFLGRLKRKFRIHTNKGSYSLCEENMSNNSHYMARSESEIYDNNQPPGHNWKESKLRSESLSRSRQNPFSTVKKTPHRQNSAFWARNFPDNQNIVDPSWLTEESDEGQICRPLLNESGEVRNDFLSLDESAIDLDNEPANNDVVNDEPGYESLEEIKLKMQLNQLKHSSVSTVRECPETPDANDSCCNGVSLQVKSSILFSALPKNGQLKNADHINKNCQNGTDNMCECSKNLDLPVECNNDNKLVYYCDERMTPPPPSTATTTLQSLNCCRGRQNADSGSSKICLNLPTLQFSCPLKNYSVDDTSPDSTDLFSDELYANPQVLIRKKSRSKQSFQESDRTSKGSVNEGITTNGSDSNGNSKENNEQDISAKETQTDMAPPLPARNYRPDEKVKSEKCDSISNWCNDYAKGTSMVEACPSTGEPLLDNLCLPEISLPLPASGIPPPLPPDNPKSVFAGSSSSSDKVSANVINPMTKLQLNEQPSLAASSLEQLLQDSTAVPFKHCVLDEPIHASLEEVFPRMRTQHNPRRSKLTASWNGERLNANTSNHWDFFMKDSLPKSLSSSKVLDEPIHASLDEVFPQRKQRQNAKWNRNSLSSLNYNGRRFPSSENNWEVVVQEGSPNLFGCTQMFPSVNGLISPEIPPPLPAKRKTNQSCLGSCKSGSLSHDVMKNLDQLRNCGWYWGPLTYEAAKALLDTKPDGSFLLRDSSDDCYILSLSFKSNGKVYHTRMEHHKGLFSFSSQPESHQRCMIKDFMEQAMQNSEDGKFLYFLQAPGPGMPPVPIRLLYPVSRFSSISSLMHLCRFSILGFVRRDLIDNLPIPESLKLYLKESQYFVETLQ